MQLFKGQRVIGSEGYRKSQDSPSPTTLRPYDPVRGFTLVELIICLSIFVFMTVLLVAKYGNFNQSVLLTDLAYDTALTIRTAQTYGLSVATADPGTGDLTPFKYAYGVDFTPQSGSGSPNDNAHEVLFADTDSPANGVCVYPDGSATPCPEYDSGDTVISTYAIQRGAIVSPASGVCGSGTCNISSGKTDQIDILFKRPDPSAIICAQVIVLVHGANTLVPNCDWTSAKIVLQGTDGSTRTVTVLQDGQISVGN